MNKKALMIFMTSIALLSVGCSSNEDINNTKEETTQSSEVENKVKLSEEEMYNLHKETMPQILEIFKNEGIDYVLDRSEKNIKYDEDTSAGFSDSSNREPGTYKIATYELKFTDDLDIICIGMDLYQNIDEEDILANGYRFEDTAFYKMIQVVAKDKLDYNKVNEDILSEYKSGNYGFKAYTFDNVNITISMDYTDISCTINIDNE